MESKIVFGEMLNYFRKEKGWTMEELGMKMGKTKSAVSRWVSGSNYPKVDDIEKLVQLFDTDVQTLVFGGEETQDLPLLSIYNELTPPRQQKVYHYAEEQLDEQQLEEHSNIYMIHGRASAAGSAIEVDDNDARMNVVNSSTIPNGADEIVKITGDSMEPLIKKGSSVYIRHQPTIENGEIAIVRIEDIGVTCKKVYKNNQQVRLKSINTTYDDMIFAADEITILGKVLL
ncbi:helix-turn-helix domain-containing protein [Dolosigranulum pigrum]|uniref:helix-turn-helix domain-containing protein n=1 Tax=Dolosigranulum pigrum TaxID=29394 RepID=UPI001FCBDD4F|nr:XRE family transcriptional regulator [Dolosigranulum pigrum]